MDEVFAFHCCRLSVISVTFQRWENSLAKVSGSFLSILRCNSSGSMDLHRSRTPNWFLTRSSSTAGVAPEPLLSTEIWATLLEKTETTKVLSTSALSVLPQPCYYITHTIQQQDYFFVVQSFTTNKVIKALLNVDPLQAWTPGELWLSKHRPYRPGQCLRRLPL